MSRDERRQDIIEAIRPLLVSGGGQFTIKEVASAAGIAEGTIFRVFASKQELMHAVVADVFDSTSLCRRIASLPAQPDLAEHLRSLIALLTEDAETTHAALTAARLASCESPRPGELRHDHRMKPPPSHSAGEMNSFRQRAREVRHAILVSLEPWQDALTVSTEQAAFIIQSTAFSALHFVFEDAFSSDPTLLADSLAHGIIKD